MNSSSSRRRSVRTCRGLLLVALLLACGCDDDPLAPFQPEVMNNPDTFQLQATGVRNANATLTYTWQNTGTTANVNQATVVTGGSANLVLKDAAGAQVYARSLAENGTFPTAAGQAGAWTIQLTLSGYSGTLNFRAQKP